MATIDGGVINIFTNSNVIVMDYTAIMFTANNAQYGGAVYFDTTYSTLVFHNHKRGTSFINNIAKFAGKDVYFDSTRSCNRSCLNTKIIGIKNESKWFIATPPSKLKLHDPATCIDDNICSEMECKNYFLKHVMFGQEIIVPTCVLDYFEQSADKTRFLLYGRNNQKYSVSGSNQFVLSCGTLQGISIIGNRSLSDSLNYSMNIAIHDDRNSDWEQISVNLTIELASCYPGFWQYPSSQKCECYNTSDIVFCFGSSSTTKRGYWSGSITEKPTVTLCLINYCNFTCCETSNGYYHISPVRDNQCRSHRSGAACGSCTDGYTLSYDSAECVNIESCTAGQTVLVVLLTVIYWMVIVVLVSAMMCYRLELDIYTVSHTNIV